MHSLGSLAGVAALFAKPHGMGATTPGEGPVALSDFVKPLFPIPALLVVGSLLYLFFGQTWRELDEDARRHRARILAQGNIDLRPFVALVLCALILTMQEYYGNRQFFDRSVVPLLAPFEEKLRLWKYEELWSYVWWSGTRIFGYVFPFFVWKLFFRKDSLRDFGLRTKGLLDHAWIYVLFLAVVLPAMFVVSREPDFGSYYPFYKKASRSWFDFLAWECMYFAQFFALEMFFRGFWLGVLRKSFGAGAIVAMAVPYCMIHYGKPYLEANGAIVAGIALGSLSMKTKSIYQGFAVHITVALLMDWLALAHRGGLPRNVWPEETEFSAYDLPAVRPGGMSEQTLVIAVIAGIAVFVLVSRSFVRWRERSRGIWVPPIG